MSTQTDPDEPTFTRILLGTLSFAAFTFLAGVAFSAFAIFGLGQDDYKFGPVGSFELSVGSLAVVTVVGSVICLAIFTTFRRWLRSCSPMRVAIYGILLAAPLFVWGIWDVVQRWKQGNPFSSTNIEHRFGNFGHGFDPAATGTIPRASTPAVLDTHGIAFRDVATERGLHFEWPEQSRPLTALGAFGCGCAFIDFDQDGWQDIVLARNPKCALFRNSSGGQFQNATIAGGVLTAEARWTGCAVGDYDGDGWLDLLITGFHQLALFLNMGDGTFSETTVAAGLDPGNHQHWGSSAGFMDLDGDEFQDLVILNYVEFGPHVKQYCELKPGVLTGCQPKEYNAERGEIWRNTGAEGFVLANDAGMQHTNGIGLVLAFADLDADLRQDFYIGNDGKLADLMHNVGDLRFENVGLASGLAFKNTTSMVPMAAMGADWGDFDRDGRFDLTVTDFQMASAGVFRNLGNMSFTDVGVSLGIHHATRNRLGFGAKWLDIDNDGWLDISYVNGHVYDNASALEKDTPFRQAMQLFRSRDGREYLDVVPALTSDVGRPIVGRGSATGDIDNDGRIDVLVVDYEGR